MTKQQAEQLYQLFTSPGWKCFLEFKAAKLDILHRHMETCKPEKLLLLQGQATEIREDFDLQSKVNDFIG